MKRRIIPIAMAVIMAVSIIAISCAQPAPAPAPAPTPAPAPAPAAPQVITLKFTSNVPSVGFNPDRWRWWSAELENRSKGRVNVQHYWGGELMKYEDELAGIPKGIADIGMVVPSYTPAEMPLNTMFDNPYNAKDPWVAMMALDEMMRTDKAVMDEMEKVGIKHIMGYSSGMFRILTKSKQVKTNADLKGLKLRALGPVRVKMMQSLGIEAIAMGYGDIYEAMDRGVIDGAGISVSLSESFRHYEVGKYIYEDLSGTSMSGTFNISLKTWNSLPPDIQGIIMQLKDDFTNYFAKELLAAEGGMLNTWKQNWGIVVSQPSAADMKGLEDAAAPACLEYAQEQEAKYGIPAVQSWTHFKDLVTKYENEVATKGYPWAPKK